MINRRQFSLMTGLGALAASGAVLSSEACADPFLPVPPASFLNYHVSTARGLSEEVAQDVTVRARLARHFGMSAPSVAEYVRQNLVETTLSASQAGRYKVACISPAGREYFVSERLAAGTPVFALATTGQPVLKLECGNPLLASLPMVQAMKPTPQRLMGAPALATDPTAVPGQTVVASTTLPGETTFAEAPALTGYEFADSGPVIGVGGITQVLTSGGGRGLGFLPGLIGAAALFGVAAGNSHGGSNNNVILAAAPEPSGALIVVLGVAGLAALGFRASRRSPAQSA